MSLSVRQYAAHRGVSHQAVSKAIKAGRITVDADGRILDAAQADAEWAANSKSEKLQIATRAHKALGMTNHDVQNHAGQMPQEILGRGKLPPQAAQAVTGTVKKPVKSESQALAGKLGTTPGQAPADDENTGVTYTKARNIKEMALAKTKVLELKKMAGELAEVGTLQKLLFGISAAVKEKLLNIAPAVSTELANMNDAHEIAVYLDAQIREALDGLADAKLNLLAKLNEEGPE